MVVPHPVCLPRYETGRPLQVPESAPDPRQSTPAGSTRSMRPAAAEKTESRSRDCVGSVPRRHPVHPFPARPVPAQAGNVRPYPFCFSGSKTVHPACAFPFISRLSWKTASMCSWLWHRADPSLDAAFRVCHSRKLWSPDPGHRFQAVPPSSAMPGARLLFLR